MTGATSREGNAEQYGDDRNLAARQSIYAFQQPVVDLWNGSLDIADLTGDETVLDIGCGNGLYLAVLRSRGHSGPVYGADLSAGMLEHRAVSGVAGRCSSPTRSRCRSVMTASMSRSRCTCCTTSPIAPGRSPSCDECSGRMVSHWS